MWAASTGSLVTGFWLFLLTGSTCRSCRERVRRVNSELILLWVLSLSLYPLKLNHSPLHRLIFLSLSLWLSAGNYPFRGSIYVACYCLLSTAPSCVASVYSVHTFADGSCGKISPKDPIWGIVICFLLRLYLTDKPIPQRYASLRKGRGNSPPMGNENRLVEAWEVTLYNAV